MEAIDYLRKKNDIDGRIKIENDSLARAFQMIVRNSEDIVIFEGVDVARMAEKGKVFGKGEFT